MQIRAIAINIYDYFLKIPCSILSSFGLFFIAMKLNTFMIEKFGTLLSNASAAFIEEAARFLSIYFVSTAFVFTPILSIGEFFMYINREPNLTASYVAMRVICVGVHLLCFYFQYTLFQKATEKDDTTYYLLAYLVGVLIHLSYNTFFAYFINAVVMTLYLN